MDKNELHAWLRLGMTEGVGNEAARRLLACFGSPQGIFDQSETALRQVVTPQQTQALRIAPHGLTVQGARTQHWLTHAPDSCSHALWTLGDRHYPAELLLLSDPP